MFRLVVFVFKQKTAYEIEYGLVGSEMCIRDSPLIVVSSSSPAPIRDVVLAANSVDPSCTSKPIGRCLLYTSDAADERSSVDLGGRRIIKKKKMQKISRNTCDYDVRSDTEISKLSVYIQSEKR